MQVELGILRVEFDGLVEIDQTLLELSPIEGTVCSPVIRHGVEGAYVVVFGELKGQGVFLLGEVILLPRSPHCICRHDRIGHHIGPHFKWLIMNRIVLGGCTNGDLLQDFFWQLRQADVGQGDRQAYFGCKSQHSMQDRTRLSFQHKLSQQSEGHFFTMQVIMRGLGRG